MGDKDNIFTFTITKNIKTSQVGWLGAWQCSSSEAGSVVVVVVAR